jgi:hypothetical protein
LRVTSAWTVAICSRSIAHSELWMGKVVGAIGPRE